MRRDVKFDEDFAFRQCERVARVILWRRRDVARLFVFALQIESSFLLVVF